MQTAIAYIRVSTDDQHLGVEAQRATITAFAAAYGYVITQEYVEHETGKGFDALDRRPQLAAAIAAAQGKTLIVAKLDRLTRNVAFGSTLVERAQGKNGFQFRIADNPTATNLLIHILLAIAEHEREMISRRTKEALAALKARAIESGVPTHNMARGNSAQAFAESLRAIIEPMRHLSSRAIAKALNERGITTATGAAWGAGTVLRLVERLA